MTVCDIGRCVWISEEEGQLVVAAVLGGLVGAEGARELLYLKVTMYAELLFNLFYIPWHLLWFTNIPQFRDINNKLKIQGGWWEFLYVD